MKNNLKRKFLPVKTKTVSWFDKGNKSIVYGIDIQIDGKDWAHIRDNDKPLFYQTRKEATQAAILIKNSLLPQDDSI